MPTALSFDHVLNSFARKAVPVSPKAYAIHQCALVLVAALLSACASGRADPSLDADAKLFRAAVNSASIYIVPSSNIANVVVTLDGRKVGTLPMENYLRLEVAPGRHVLSVSRDTLVPAVLRETRDDVTVDAEAGHCYFLRTAWTDAGENWREFRVYWESMTESEGQRAVNVRWLTLPQK